MANVESMTPAQKRAHYARRRDAIDKMVARGARPIEVSERYGVSRQSGWRMWHDADRRIAARNLAEA